MSLYIETIGQHGPDIVLLHGWAMHGGVFTPLAARLRGRCRLHLVDLPGHGRSRDSDLPLQLDACADAIASSVPDNAHWCGWSLGGLVALNAAQRGLPMQSLTMLCATPCFVRKDDWHHGMSAEIFQDFAESLREDWRGTLDRFLALEAFGSDHAKEELRALRDELFARGEPATSVLADGLELLENRDLRAGLSALDLPSLWIAGRCDRLVNPRAMQEAVAMTPAAHLAVIEHAGHAPFLTHADEVIAAWQPMLDGAA